MFCGNKHWFSHPQPPQCVLPIEPHSLDIVNHISNTTVVDQDHPIKTHADIEALLEERVRLANLYTFHHKHLCLVAQGS